jgi:hypothetical protein
MQQISGLTNLRALHIGQLRNDDTCVWVMRETKRFLIDALAHYPELKLEWISIDEEAIAEQVIRPSKGDKSKKKKTKSKSKSKGKEKAPTLGGPMSDVYPLLSLNDDDGLSESEDEENEDEALALSQGVSMSDVWGVKIFQKEIISGRL